MPLLAESTPPRKSYRERTTACHRWATMLRSQSERNLGKLDRICRLCRDATSFCSRCGVGSMTVVQAVRLVRFKPITADPSHQVRCAAGPIGSARHKHPATDTRRSCVPRQARFSPPAEKRLPSEFPPARHPLIETPTPAESEHPTQARLFLRSPAWTLTSADYRLLRSLNGVVFKIPA